MSASLTSYVEQGRAVKLPPKSSAPILKQHWKQAQHGWLVLPDYFRFRPALKAHSNSREEADAGSKSQSQNPKLDPNPPTNMEKEPEDWVSGDEPMTGAQASYLKTLAEQAGDPDAYDRNLTKAEASKRIDALKQELGLE